MKAGKLFQFLFSVVLLMPLATSSQSLDRFSWFNEYYADELYLGLGYSNLSMSNPEAPQPEEHELSGWTIKLEMKVVRYEKGEVSRYWEHKLVGDMVGWYSRFRRDDASVYVTQASNVSTGLLGWWSWVWNLTEPKRFSVAAGFNANDYFLTSSYVEHDSIPYDRIDNNTRYEPNGYYFGAGPTVRANFMLTSNFQLEYFGSLSIPFGRVTAEDFENQDDDYPNPYFMNHYLELISSYGVYAGYEFTDIINRGDIPNNTKRREWYIGFRIMI